VGSASSSNNSGSPRGHGAGAMIHEVLPVGLLRCNCHIVGDAATHEAIVIDPGEEVDRILAVLRRHGLKVRAILITHAHIDHVGGLRKLREATGAPVMMHREDLQLYRDMEAQAAWSGFQAPALTEVDDFLREEQSIRWAGYDMRVLHTPGHSKGSVCLYLPLSAGEGTGAHAGKPIGRTPSASGAKRAASGTGAAEPSAATGAPGMLFAGDTLFAGNIGRTDLWGGSFEEIMRSLREKLLTLPEDVGVFPGHGPATTIGAERETNPFLRGA